MMSDDDMGIWYRVLWRPSILPGVNTLIALSIEQDRRDAQIMADLSREPVFDETEASAQAAQAARERQSR